MSAKDRITLAKRVSELVKTRREISNREQRDELARRIGYLLRMLKDSKA